MNSKNLKKQSAKMLANVSLALGKASANSRCCYIYHQPKMPDELKKMRKF
nr:cyclic lactone autoinducer peptide [uncultured Schaedlerella sp.]